MTAEQFVRLVEADVFCDKERIGLWDGLIYDKRPKTLPIAVASTKLQMTLLFE